MTSEELEAMKRREREATPGPWYPVATDDGQSMNARYVGKKQRRWPNHDQERGMEDESRCREVVAITLIQYPRFADICDERWDENAEFIAAARTDVPKLVEEVEKLRAFITRMGNASCKMLSRYDVALADELYNECQRMLGEE